MVLRKTEWFPIGGEDRGKLGGSVDFRSSLGQHGFFFVRSVDGKVRLILEMIFLYGCDPSHKAGRSGAIDGIS